MAKVKEVGNVLRLASEDKTQFRAFPTDNPDLTRWSEVRAQVAGGKKFDALRKARGAEIPTGSSSSTGQSVLVSNSWATIPQCDCALAKRKRSDENLFCQHVVRLMLQEPSLRYQLFDMFV